MELRNIINSRLIFVSGKGGVGKTCVASALAKTSASFGKKTLVVEVDNFYPSLPSIFGKKISYTPVEIEKNIYACNISWLQALEDWLTRTIKIRGVAHLILSNKVVMVFLNATPGAREIVILSKIMELLDKYDQVIVDLPASGHALGILRVPQTAIQLMRSGPIYDRAKQILSVFSSPKTCVLLCALPEEMVVNETVEFFQKIKDEVPQLRNIHVLLNRISTPSFSEEEKELFQRMETVAQNTVCSELEKYIGIAEWDYVLEESSINSIQRLEQELQQPVLSLAKFGLLGGFSGGTPKVVEQMYSAFTRILRTDT